MGIFETLLLYAAAGLAVAGAAAIASDERGLAAAGWFVPRALMWPFFAPLLLGRALSAASPPSRSPSTDDGSAVDVVEKMLVHALRNLGGIAEEVLSPELERVRNLATSLRRVERRIADMDELLASTEFDEAAAREAIARFDRGTGACEDPRLESLRARVRNIRRLRSMRAQAGAELERALLRLEEMHSQLLLLRFADNPESEVAELIANMASSLDGFSEGVFEPAP